MTYRSKGEFETLQSRLDDYRQENERQQARIAALEAELAAKGWRPVSEPPKKDGVCLVWRGHNVEPPPGWAEISGYATHSALWRIDYPHGDSVTHWQPLPAPPQDAE